jgi:RIO kinase 2
MRNHERVPVELVGALSGNRGARRALQVLLRHKLVHHESRPYESYRLTPLGYDYLALRALRERSSVCSVGGLIGTGKESDVHEVLGGVDGSELFVLKVHRLGRTSFRRARTKRGYCERTPFVPEEATSDVAAGSSGRLLPQARASPQTGSMGILLGLRRSRATDGS